MLIAHLGQLNPSSRIGSGRQAVSASTSAASRHQDHRAPSPILIPPHGLTFANPEILGDPPEADFDNNDPENMKMDPRSTGRCDQGTEDDECFDPAAIEKMEFEERAIWLGKWFALHYAAWVSEFDMKELENYEVNKKTVRDTAVGPLLMLCWTFRRFRLPEIEWRSPMFCSPVRCSLFQTGIRSCISSFDSASGAFATRSYQPFAHMPSAYLV